MTSPFAPAPIGRRIGVPDEEQDQNGHVAAVQGGRQGVRYGVVKRARLRSRRRPGRRSRSTAVLHRAASRPHPSHRRVPTDHGHLTAMAAAHGPARRPRVRRRRRRFRLQLRAGRLGRPDGRPVVRRLHVGRLAAGVTRRTGHGHPLTLLRCSQGQAPRSVVSGGACCPGASDGRAELGYGTSLRSLLGEPVPMPVRTSLVAPFTSAAATVAGEAPG